MSLVDTSVLRGRLDFLHVLGDEGFRLFFPLSALYAAGWPFLWVVVHGYELPVAGVIPPSIWHVHEMIIGAFGAALLGFLTTAIPEWTDTPRLRGKALYALAAIWGVARICGLVGAEGVLLIGAIADIVWIGFLAAYVLGVSLDKTNSRLIGFILWLAGLWLCETATRYAFATGNVEHAQLFTHISGFIFLGLLGLALARITAPVTNDILDPSGETSPFRPHPGRLNLAPGVMALLIAAELSGFSPKVTGFVFVATGAAFLDRMAEAFVGRAFFRAEIAVLAGSSALAGIGLNAIGCARLGLPVMETTGLHMALMGGLGLGVIAVFCIAGLRHTGQPLAFSVETRIAIALIVIAIAIRTLPEFGIVSEFVGHHHAVAAIFWAGGFLLWLRVYWPAFADPATLNQHDC